MKDKKPRPRTLRTDTLEKGDIVWDDEQGWGIVLGLDGTYRLAHADTHGESADCHDARACHAVSWPDVEQVKTVRGPLHKVLEPVKLLGSIESSPL